MHQVTILSQNQIGVMAVLDLQNVTRQTVCSQRVCKVVPSLFESVRGRQSIVYPEVVVQVAILPFLFTEPVIHFLVDAIYSETVFYEFEEAAIRPRRYDLIREQPQVELFQFEDLIHHGY